jgi:hypothetical protein
MATSRDLRVPKMIEWRDDAFEVATLGMLKSGEHLLEGRAEGIADDLRPVEEIKRVNPSGRQRRRLYGF